MRSFPLRFLLAGCSIIKGRLWFTFRVLFLFHVVMFHTHLLWAQSVAPVAARTIHGVVKSGNMPIPGAGVTASSAATKAQVNTWTEVDGSYWLRIPADGHYTVRVQMAAFAANSQEVVLDTTHQDVQANFEAGFFCPGRAKRATNNSGGRMRADAVFRIFPYFRVARDRMRPVVP